MCGCPRGEDEGKGVSGSVEELTGDEESLRLYKSNDRMSSEEERDLRWNLEGAEGWTRGEDMDER
jgi:hypothetical protein